MTHTTPIPTKTALFGLLCDANSAGHAAAALGGDEIARDYACVDHLEERGENMVPFSVGEKHLIQTETLYWIGEIVAISGGFLMLKDASWVHWTGRLGALCAAMSFTPKKWPSGSRRPRTEYIGDGVRVSLSKIVDSICKDWELPTESVVA